MRFGTSLFDWTLFKKNVTRFWPIWASYLTIWMFILPIYLMMTTPYDTSWFISTISDSAAWHLWFSLFYGCFGAMAVLSHLYTPRSANFYGALPVRREGIFLTQYLSGLAFVLVPDVIVAASTALVGAGVPGSFAAALGWLAVGCGMYFFFYTFAVFCGMFAGHILALPAFYGIMNCLVYAVVGLFSLLMERFYRGYDSMGSAVEEAVKWLTPVYKLNGLSRSGQYLDSDLIPIRFGGTSVLVVYVLCALVLAAASLLLYRARRMESAGDVVAVRAMRPVFKYGVAVCTGLAVGYVTSAVLGEESLPYCVVVWTVIGCFAAQMILDKTFRVFKKWKGAAAAALAVTAVMLAMNFDLTGFETWVPDPADVEYVEVYGLGGAADISDSADWYAARLTEREQIEKITALHKLAISGPGEGNLRVNITITYRTKTGAHSRWYGLYVDSRYANTPGTLAYYLEQLYADRELYWRLYGFDRLESFLDGGGRLSSVRYKNNSDDYDSYPELSYGYFREHSRLDITGYAGQMELWEAIKADFEDGNIGLRHVSLSDNASTVSGSRTVILSWESYDSVSDVIYSNRAQIAVPDTATRTIEVLLRLIPQELASQEYLEPGEENLTIQ